MTKQEEFLWIVQTAVLANAINLSSDVDTRKEYRHVYSSTGVRITMAEAIRASARIPDDMEAADAADDFCLWCFDNHREAARRENPEANVPYWFARG